MLQNFFNCCNNFINIWTNCETIAETFEQLLKQLQKNWTIVETIAETLNNCWNNCGNMWYKFKCSPCNPSPEAFWKHSIYILTLYICCIEIYYLIIWLSDYPKHHLFATSRGWCQHLLQVLKILAATQTWEKVAAVQSCYKVSLYGHSWWNRTFYLDDKAW